jgi:uncharacterized protein with PIN domain
MEPRFVADGNVGKLARRLRMLGFDAIFAHPVEDDELVAIAAREGRVLLTRDTYILHRRVVFDGTVRAILITRDDVQDQLRQVLRHLGLRPPFAFFSRCLECNVPLESVSREQVADEVPPFVLRTQTSFTRCPLCHRVYWAGTHRDHMLREIEEMVEGGGES